MRKQIDGLRRLGTYADRATLFLCVVLGSMLALWMGLDKVFGFWLTLGAVILYSFGIESSGNTVKNLPNHKWIGVTFYVAMSLLVSLTPLAIAFGLDVKVVGTVVAGLFAGLFTCVKALAHSMALSDNEEEISVANHEEELNKVKRNTIAGNIKLAKEMYGATVWKNYVDVSKIEEGVFALDTPKQSPKKSSGLNNSANNDANKSDQDNRTNSTETGGKRAKANEKAERLLIRLYEQGDPITNRYLQDNYRLSKGGAGRLLSQWTDAGYFEKKGAGRSVHYIPNGVVPEGASVVKEA